MSKTIITVDFDFFVPEDPMLDWSHQESLMFLKMIWGSRIGAMDKVKTDGNELIFWDWLGKQVDLKTVPMFVSDSHCYAYNVLLSMGHIDRVILFDAHHDCWGDSMRDGENGVYCDSWLRLWLTERKGKSRRATWVKPSWEGGFNLPKDMADRVQMVRHSKGLDLGLGGSVVLHVCRSGCWVPPWLDKAFLGFLRASGRGLEGMTVLQNGEWNPLAERWSEKDMQDILAQEAKVRQVFRKTGMVIGTVSSRNFLNCKVEQRV